MDEFGAVAEPEIQEVEQVEQEQPETPEQPEQQAGESEIQDEQIEPRYRRFGQHAGTARQVTAQNQCEKRDGDREDRLHG